MAISFQITRLFQILFLAFKVYKSVISFAVRFERIELLNAAVLTHSVANNIRFDLLLQIFHVLSVSHLLDDRVDNKVCRIDRAKTVLKLL